MKKVLITNVAYGETYADIFLNQHLKSFLDESNIPAVATRVEYLIFTDSDTYPIITRHPNFIKLKKTCAVSVQVFNWGGHDINRFGARYGVLMYTFRISVTEALKRGAYLSALVGDLVCAHDFLPRILKRMDDGHGAVFMLPLRAAAESTIPYLDQNPRALSDMELCALGYTNLHPLWVACHWRAPQFTKLPFSLLWNSGTGILARSFSITPIIFQPTVEMETAEGVIDRAIPSMCANPYWCTDWTDAPIIGVEPLVCYYPTFANHVGTAKWVAEWSKCLHPTQLDLALAPLYYPNQAMCAMPAEQFAESQIAVNNILKEARK